jgi:hypothetical protein
MSVEDTVNKVLLPCSHGLEAKSAINALASTIASSVDEPNLALGFALAGAAVYAVSVGFRQTGYWLVRERPGEERLSVEIVQDPLMEYLDE